MVFFKARISPFTSTVIFEDRSPSAMASLQWAVGLGLRYLTSVQTTRSVEKAKISEA